MNPGHLIKLVEHFNFTQINGHPQRVKGGLLHIMWRLDTTTGSYAIKQLSKKIDLKNEKIIRNYELTEHIAFLFASQGIPAIYAINKDKRYLLIIDDVGYLSYPWVNAKSLDKDVISETHALKTSSMLAKIHFANLSIEEIKEPEFDLHSNQVIIELEKLAREANAVFYSNISSNLNTLLEINKNYHNAIAVLRKQTVISHGDLDQKNVLWDHKDDPYFIDWESARKLNPTYEIINAALDWSGITTTFDKILFKKMILAYQEAGGLINKNEMEAAFWGVLGNWINWMVYNIKRAILSADPEQKKIGTEQVNQALSTILRIKNLMPELINRYDL